MLIMEYLIYIISISFQVAGALLLVVYFISTKRKAVIKKFAGNGTIHLDNNTQELTYNEKAFFDEYKMAYIQRLSFVYILAGYLSGVFGSLSESIRCRVIALVIIAILSLALMFFSNKGVELYVRKKNKAFKITNDELKELGIKPDSESISNSQLDKICDSTSQNDQNERS